MERIKVAIRIKPESGEGLRGFDYNNNGTDGLSRLELIANGTKNEFTYDHIFGPDATQVGIFETVCLPIINRVLEGFNGTLFAYGQTGAGKTHTVTGPAKDDYNERGLCTRTVEYIFRSIKSAKDSVITVRFSVIEIYNDTVLDLLRESLHDSPKLVIVDTPNGVIVPALYLLPLENEEEAFAKLYEANLNRSVAEHQLNRRSSRSHVIYSFYITRSRSDSASGGGDIVDSKLHLVDLAGSERIEKTGSTGGLVKEAAHINKSLSFLEQVVLSLTKKAANATLGAGQTKKDFIPAYRQSKLTYILKDSLGGNCNTVLVCCIWPHVNHLWETISSLRFASRMRCIENHPQRNSLTNGNASVSSSTRSLQLKIESLKKELIMRDMMCGYAMYSHSSPQSDSLGRTPILDTLSQPQLNSCQKMASRYILSGAEKDIDIRSLVEMRTILNIMRTMIWNSCGGDLANVERLLKESSPENGDNVADFMSRATPRHDNQPQSHPIDPISEASNEEGDGEPFNPAKEHESSTSGRNEASPTLPNNRHDPFIPIPTNPDLVESSSVAGEDSDPFELFKKGKGKELHQAYESLKFDLKEAKNRQKALVKEVNQTKIEIDALSGHIQNLEISSPRPAEEIADQQSTLSELKAQYKQRRNDLISLKEEILDLNRRKQLALNALVSGYEDYVQARKEQGQEQRDYAVNPDAFESLIVDDLLRQRGGKSSVSPS